MALTLPSKQKVRGFTLIELLIAMAIIAIAFTALIRSMDTQIKSLNRLENKILAHFAAHNTLSKIQLGLLSVDPNETAKSTGKLLDRNLFITVNAEKTPQNGVVHYILSVQSSNPHAAPYSFDGYGGSKI